MLPRTLRALCCFSITAQFCCQDLFAQAEGDGITHLEGLTDDHLNQVHNDWDGNGNKKVSKEELYDFVEKHRQGAVLSDPALSEMYQDLDTSKDGFVSLEEHLVSGQKISSDEQVETAKFRAADANSDGLLSKAELAALYFPETHEGVLNITVQDSMKRYDTDGNGKLSFEEFRDADVAQEAFSHTQNEDVMEADDPGHSQVFKELDANADGFVDIKELRPLKSGRSNREKVVSELVDSVDGNGDAHIDADELVQRKDFVNDSMLQAYLIAWAKKSKVAPR